MHTSNELIKAMEAAEKVVSESQSIDQIYGIRAGSPPVITIMGDKDPIVPFAQAQILQVALDKAGIANQLVTIHGGGHGTVAPFAWTRDQVLEAQAAVFAFLEKHGVLAPKP